jgi:hypothetical protein
MKTLEPGIILQTSYRTPKTDSWVELKVESDTPVLVSLLNPLEEVVVTNGKPSTTARFGAFVRSNTLCHVQIENASERPADVNWSIRQVQSNGCLLPILILTTVALVIGIVAS